MNKMKEYKTNIDKLSLIREKTDIKRAKITNSGHAERYARNFFGEDITLYESFFLLLLNNANNTVGYVKISQGGITGTVVDVRIIAKYAVETLVPAVMIFHNHPSGTLKPSQADINLTKKLREGL